MKNKKNINFKKVVIVAVLTIIMVFLFTGCLPGDGANTASNKAGFFFGVWHGWIAPVSLIFGLFDKNITIYETNNVGWFYDFGYYIAVISGFGGFALSRKKRVVVKEKHIYDD